MGVVRWDDPRGEYSLSHIHDLISYVPREKNVHHESDAAIFETCTGARNKKNTHTHTARLCGAFIPGTYLSRPKQEGGGGVT